VVATETVEHDIRNRMGKPILPRFRNDPSVVDGLRRAAGTMRGFRVHFGPMASGDEDVVDRDRREELRRTTGAIAAAWEGAGGARACLLSRLPFVEIRGITDRADGDASANYGKNLSAAMTHVAALVVAWAEASARPEVA